MGAEEIQCIYGWSIMIPFFNYSDYKWCMYYVSLYLNNFIYLIRLYLLDSTAFSCGHVILQIQELNH